MTDMEEQPRKRAKYFKDEEREFLIALVEKDAAIVESRRSDMRMIDLKKKVWARISAEFNSCPGVQQRSGQQLKKCWENLRSRAKKDPTKKALFNEDSAHGIGVVPDRMPFEYPIAQTNFLKQEVTPDAILAEIRQMTDNSQHCTDQAFPTTEVPDTCKMEPSYDTFEASSPAPSESVMKPNTFPFSPVLSQELPTRQRLGLAVASALGHDEQIRLEHEMQMKVWQAKLEKHELWKKEHELRMQVLHKQLEVLSSDDNASILAHSVIS